MTLVWDKAKLAALFTESGPVAANLTVRAIRVEAAAVRFLHQPGHGITYNLSNPTRTHTASAPGEPPATDLGALAASISHGLGFDALGLYAWVGSNLDKAPWLERGTSRMAPRPFLRPALQAARN